MICELSVDDYYCEMFLLECKRAYSEYLRLCSLFKDCCWYSFETACLTWRHPWRVSDRDSIVCLQGVRHELTAHGEHTSFPNYYCGRLADAPLLPLRIVLAEMHEAKRYWNECAERCTAPYDWAPGGKLYEELRKPTLVGKHLPTQ